MEYTKYLLLLALCFSSLVMPAQPIIQWQKCLGGTGYEEAHSIQQSTDGGYIVEGYSKSNDGDVSGHHGPLVRRDYWVVKTDQSGTIEWQKSLGGSDSDEANSIQQTTDGGYIVAGFSSSTDGDITGTHGGMDYWLVKLDSVGNLQWQKSFGGTGDDRAYFIQQSSDGGYVVAGYSGSNDGDATGNHGGMDYWLVKLDSMGILR